jgi:thiol-disulfide isomerase/thioredoxin
VKLRLGALAAGALAVGAIVAAGVVLARGDGADGAAPVEAGGKAGRPAPELEGVDPVTGEQVSLAQFRGKPVVINVWASWCPGCIDEAADLRRFAEAHPEAVVLGLDFQDTYAGARDFYRDWGWEHPSIFDLSGSQTAALGLQGLPMTYFLTPEHRIAAQVVGATDLEGFEAGLVRATIGS